MGYFFKKCCLCFLESRDQFNDQGVWISYGQLPQSFTYTEEADWVAEITFSRILIFSCWLVFVLFYTAVLKGCRTLAFLMAMFKTVENSPFGFWCLFILPFALPQAGWRIWHFGLGCSRVFGYLLTFKIEILVFNGTPDIFEIQCCFHKGIKQFLFLL